MTASERKHWIHPPARTRALESLLQGSGWGGASISPLAGDASFRRYLRLQSGGRRAVLMDAPPGRESLAPFCRVAALLQAVGLSAPAVLAVDHAAGLMLLEDLGERSFTRALEAGTDEGMLYTLATDTLLALHRRVEGAVLDTLPAFDDERALGEAALLLDWYWPAVHGTEAPAGVRAGFEQAWREVLPHCREVDETVVLFDFHVDNLMHLPRPGVRACGLLDFQDAVRAPAPFDLVSLLKDVRRDVSPGVARSCLQRYLDGRPELEPATFHRCAAVLGAQRNTRIVGTFARLALRDDKPAYQRFMPRVWALLAGDLAQAVMQPVARWFDRHLPPGRRVALSGPDGGRR